jgi:hypothetical protein
MRALVDRHQADLFYSLQLLFEDRMGGEVYTPIGHEWWDEGYWRFGQVFGDDRLARQYLATDTWMPSPVRGVWTAFDSHHPGRRMRGIERAAVEPGGWDYVVATVQENQQGFARLARELGAKFVYQVGNTRQEVDWSLDPLALVSSEVLIRGRGLRYHQEFDAATTFRYRPPTADLVVRSFMNCFPSVPCHSLFTEARRLAPDWTWAVHGIDGPEGNIATAREIADLMAASAFGWHDKPHGDGFGHVIHQWAAVGRPLVGHRYHYAGLMAEPFWEDGATAIMLDARTPTDALRMMRDIMGDPPAHEAMCRTIRARFEELVDFDAEAARIVEFLS